MPPAVHSLDEAKDIRQLLEMTEVGKTIVRLLPAMLAPLKKVMPKVP